jgi:large subunit ribosomal protein L32
MLLRVLKPRPEGGLTYLRILAAAGFSGRKHERNFVMPNPKRRHSTRRTANRRSHDFLTAVGVSECPNCHEKKLPHRACPKCGAYKGRAVLDIKEAAK